MDQIDPYELYDRNLDAAAAMIFKITPDDDNPLPRVIKRLRVYNSTEEVMSITIRAVRSDEPVTLACPPLSIIWEDIRIAQVYKTGTDWEALVIYGYSD